MQSLNDLIEKKEKKEKNLQQQLFLIQVSRLHELSEKCLFLNNNIYVHHLLPALRTEYITTFSLCEYKFI